MSQDYHVFLKFYKHYFQTSTYMLPQQLLTVTSQSTEVITSQLAHRQRLKRSIEVMRTLKAQQGLFEITPTPDLRRGAEAEGQIMAF